ARASRPAARGEPRSSPAAGGAPARLADPPLVSGRAGLAFAPAGRASRRRPRLVLEQERQDERDDDHDTDDVEDAVAHVSPSFRPLRLVIGAGGVPPLSRRADRAPPSPRPPRRSRCSARPVWNVLRARAIDHGWTTHTSSPPPRPWHR